MTVTMALVREVYAKLNASTGRGHWFERSTMRFFRSRLPRRAYVGPGGVFFVTSEQFIGSGGAAPRAYSVRAWRGETVETVGDFNRLERSEAVRLAREYATAVE